MRIVLIEDNATLTQALVRGLDEEGFHVVAAATGALGLAAFEDPRVRAAIIDLGLPDTDGLEVVREARAAGFTAPILILTARDAVKERVAGLDAGADDYLIKPFAFQELLARLRALGRRTALPRRIVPSSPDFALVESPLGVRVAGRSIELSPREYALLELLLQQRGQVLTRTTILREVFGYDFNPGTNIVEVHIAHLRRKLGAASSLVRTVRGAGYLLASVEQDGV